MFPFPKKRLSIDFGNVCPGSKTTKYVSVPFSSTDDNEIMVRRTNSTHKLDSLFHVSKDARFKSSTEHKLKCTFTPLLPFMVCIDYFDVLGRDGTALELLCIGHSTGPDVKSTVTRVQLRSTGGGSARKAFHLRNDSTLQARFHFDHDNVHSPLTVEPVEGSIAPAQNVKVVVTYKAVSCDPYYKALVCLVQHQAPVVIGVLCTWAEQDDTSPDRTQNEKETFPEAMPVFDNGYDRYMNDCARLIPVCQRPIVTLSEVYFNFGRVQVESEGARFTFSVTNHSKRRLRLKWQKGLLMAFQVQPASMMIPSQHSVQFEAVFKPKTPDLFYNADVDAAIYWGEDFNQLIPVPISVHFAGHSFGVGSCGWEPECSFEPASLPLPVTIPGQCTYATLVIRRLGCLPVLFQFTPPPQSYFTVKPMVGVIRGGCQIVVVQLLPPSKVANLYSERWGLILNTGLTRHWVVFRGSSEFPSVTIGRHGIVEFPAVHPGASETITVPIWNNTDLPLRYVLESNGSGEARWLRMGQDCGLLEGNERSQTEWTFRAPWREGQYMAKVTCWSQAQTQLDSVSQHRLSSYDVALVSAASCFAQITAEPNVLEFGNVLRGVWASQVVTVHNAGPSSAQLCLMLESCCFSSIVGDVKVTPKCLLLPPNMSKEVKVAINFNEVGIQNLALLYSFVSDATLGTGGQLCLVNIDVVFPSLHIVDIRSFKVGPNFSKLYLWKVLNINSMNKVLSEMVPHKTESVMLTLPEAPKDTPTMTIELLIQNTSKVTAFCCINMERVCNCVPIKCNTGISTTKLVDMCPHASQIRCSPNVAVIQPKQQMSLTLHVDYTTFDFPVLHYIVTLAPKDHRNLLCSLRLLVLHQVLPKDKPSIARYTAIHADNIFQFQLDRVFIGDNQPQLQAFRLYNNSTCPVNYKVDTVNLRSIGSFLTCLNPEGIIHSFSSFNLIFLFKPNMLETYQISTSLQYGGIERELLLTGQGNTAALAYPNNNIYAPLDMMPPTTQFKGISHPPSGICFSTDHLVTHPFSIHNSMTCLFYMNNTTPNTFRFHWLRAGVSGLYVLQMEPSSGELGPNSAIACRLVMQSLSYPVRVTTSVTCTLIDLTKKCQYEQSLQLEREEERRFDSYFCITEAGTFFPECKNFALKVPVPFHESVSLNLYTYSARYADQAVRKLQELLHQPAPWQLTSSCAKSSSQKPLTHQEAVIITDVLTLVIWEIVSSKWFLLHTRPEPPPMYYRLIPEYRSGWYQRTENQPPRRLIQHVFEEAIFNIVNELFLPNTLPTASEQRIQSSTTNITVPLFNSYYKNLLSEGYEEKSSLMEFSDASIYSCRSRSFDAPLVHYFHAVTKTPTTNHQ